MAYGFERTAFERLLHVAGAAAVHARAGLQHLVTEAVAGAEQEQRLVAELLRGDSGFPAPCVAGGHDDSKGFVVDGLRIDAGIRIRQRQDRDVEVAVPEQLAELRGEVFLQQQRHVRRAFVHDGYQLRQQVRAYRIDGADAQRRCELVFALRRDVFDGRGFFEHALRLLDDARAQRRHGNF